MRKFLKDKNMNKELIIKKRSLFENGTNFQNPVLEKELRNSVSPEEYRAKLLECVAKHYENLQS